LNRVIANQPGVNRNVNSRRAAKIQERFNALPLDVQQEIMRLREPEARATLSLTSKEKHSEAA
jgi:hypothetical protein